MIEVEVSRVIRCIRKQRLVIVIMLAWYLAMYPGALPFDSSEAIRLIQRGQSVDWWSGSFFWLLRASSFNGHTISVSSALGYMALVSSLYYLIKSFSSLSDKVIQNTFTILVLSPIVSVFGLTVSHDTYIVSGILLLVGVQFRRYLGNITFREDLGVTIVAGFLLTTTRAFFFYLGVILIVWVRQKTFRSAILIFCICLSFNSLSYVGITKEKNYTFIHVLSDLKCVVQHSETQLDSDDLRFLQKIAPIERWKKMSQCSNIEKIVRELDPNYNQLNWSLDFLKMYTKIIAKSPAIYFQAKLQRSVVALPPPFFFRAPINMVSADLSRPIGLGTNWSLQENGPGLLHPSIDEPTMNKRIKGQEVFRIPALASIYFINQASWFWGWGGLWLWPGVLIPFLLLRISRLRSLILVLYPLLALHFAIIAIGPAAEARHVAATIIAGYSFTVLGIVKFLDHRSKL